MNFEEIIQILGKKLKPLRFEHSIGVMNTAEILAVRFGADAKKAKLAGILHDCAKYIDEEEGYKLCSEWEIELDEVSLNNYAVVHQYLGARIAQDEYEIEDVEILNAIKCHATGKKDMTKLEKIIYLADMIEPNRQKRPYDGLNELIKLSETDLNKATLRGLELSCMHVIRNGKLVHLDTIAARNSIILEQKRN